MLANVSKTNSIDPIHLFNCFVFEPHYTEYFGIGGVDRTILASTYVKKPLEKIKNLLSPNNYTMLPMFENVAPILVSITIYVDVNDWSKIDEALRKHIAPYENLEQEVWDEEVDPDDVNGLMSAIRETIGKEVSLNEIGCSTKYPTIEFVMRLC